MSGGVPAEFVAVAWATVRDVLAEYLCMDWADDEGLGCADEPPCFVHYVEAGEALEALGAADPDARTTPPGPAATGETP